MAASSRMLTVSAVRPAVAFAAIARAVSLALIVAVTVWSDDSQAVVSPVMLIEQQIQKPNILLVLDTSTSMQEAPGNNSMQFNDVGMDCDDGDDQCRSVGQ